MPNLRRERLQERSQLPAAAFDKLWETVKRHLRNEPENSIGVGGPGHPPSGNGANFSLWTINYLESGIGERFWGLEAGRKLNLADNRAEIVDFFRRLVITIAMNERDHRKRSKTYQREDEDLEEWEEDDDGDDEEYVDDTQYQSSLRTFAGTSWQGSLLTRRRASGTQASQKRIKLSTSADTDSGLFKVTRDMESSEESEGDIQYQVPGPAWRPSTIRLSPRKSIPRTELRASPVNRIKESIPENIDPKTTNNEQSPRAPDTEGTDHMIKVRLGPDYIITPIFVPLTIDFRGFIEYFCEGLGFENGKIDSEKVKVKVLICGLMYRIIVGKTRERIWSYLMGLARDAPESEITVDLDI